MQRDQFASVSLIRSSRRSLWIAKPRAGDADCGTPQNPNRFSFLAGSISDFNLQEDIFIAFIDGRRSKRHPGRNETEKINPSISEQTLTPSPPLLYWTFMAIGLLSIVALGFVLGMRHATDADHVIAVTTIVSRQGSVRNATLIGALWGVGHSLTICVVGTAIIVFHVLIPPRVGLAMELCVGLMLVFLGVLNLTGALQWICSRLTPGGRQHREFPSAGSSPAAPHDEASLDYSAVLREEGQSPGWFDRAFGKNLDRLGIYQFLRPLVVGVVHGLAGSAAVSLLVLATIQNPYWDAVYLLVFGLGTITGMAAVTAALAVPIAYSSLRFDRVNRKLAVASGLLSLGFGLVISWQIGITGGLFSSHPIWIPR